jgi:hypothetical protein
MGTGRGVPVLVAPGGPRVTARSGCILRVAYAAAGVDWANSGGYTPTLAQGEEFSVCVTVTVWIPFLPEFIDQNTATGQFVVERDRYVDS